jgi:hypothetical protein
MEGFDARWLRHIDGGRLAGGDANRRNAAAGATYACRGAVVMDCMSRTWLATHGALR